MTKRQKIQDASVPSYDQERVQQLRRNEQRMKDLGIPSLVKSYSEISKQTRKKGNAKQHDASDPEYDPQEEEGMQENENNDTFLVETDALENPPSSRTNKASLSSNTMGTKKQPARMLPGVSSGSKRVAGGLYPYDQPGATKKFTRRTAALLGLPPENPTITPTNSLIGARPPIASGTKKANNEDWRVEGRSSIPPSSNKNSNEKNLTEAQLTIDPATNNTNNEEMHQPVDPSDFLEPTECPMHDEDTINEGAIQVSKTKKNRSGKGLERMSKGLGSKISISIAEGDIRPAAPIQAAKFASEAGITLREHIPILPRWKDYEKKPEYISDFIGKVAGKFTVDTTAPTVKFSMEHLLKGGQRQRRHRLKKAFFIDVAADKVPTTSPVEHMSNEQWADLVCKWTDKRNKDIAEQNKINRSKVQFKQRTGSRHFTVQRKIVRDKLNGLEPTAIDLFKETHISKENGYSTPVKAAVDKMDNIMREPVPEGEEPKSPTTIVAEVLTEERPTNKFIKNIGLPPPSSKRSDSSRVQELQLQLQASRQQKVDLLEKIRAQDERLEALNKRTEEAEEASKKRDEYVDDLKNKLEDTNSLLRGFLGLVQGQSNVSK